jgi:hypothetical protein
VEECTDKQKQSRHSTFLSYFKRFAAKLWSESFSWARDNILLGVLVLIVPPLSVYMQHPDAKLDWGTIRVALYIYAALFACYYVVHFWRTLWILDDERIDEIETVNAREAQAKFAMAHELERSNQELEKLKESQAEIEIKLLEMHRFPSLVGLDRDEHGAMAWDIFALARLELHEPQFASVLAYSFAVSQHGQQNLYANERDVEQWQLVFWNPKQPTTNPMQPLGFDLRSGIPREGWVHFKVDKATAKALDECTIWMIADVGRHGIATGEQSAIWNLDLNKRIGRKP